MNALRQPLAILLRAGFLAGACGVLSGCIGDPFREAQVDPSSPVAPDVARMTSAKASFPSFKDIPTPSKDGRPLRLYGQAAKQLQLAAADLETATAPNTWTLQGTEGFAAGARRDVGPELPPAAPAATEADVKALRERATPPPRPRR
jgi:hypothetical protein